MCIQLYAYIYIYMNTYIYIYTCQRYLYIYVYHILNLNNKKELRQLIKTITRNGETPSLLRPSPLKAPAAVGR